jgi:RNA polymerase sigma factor (TIGR02999 family)
MRESLSTETATELMQKFRQGDRNAVDRLVELWYPELRKIAANRMKGERMEHTWQPTVLINELYLELTKVRNLDCSDHGDKQERSAFLGFSGHIMKRFLQHHARPLYRQWDKVSLSEGLCPDNAKPETLQEVEDALTQLAAINPKLRAVVEMRVFEGLTSAEIGARLGCSRRSATVYWNVAKRWLQTEWAGRLDEKVERTAAASSTVSPPQGSQHVGSPASDRGNTMERQLL